MLKRVKDIKRVLETFKNTKPFYLNHNLKHFSENPEVTERLSNIDEDLKQRYKWLGNEESMRKHFNILDWDEVEKKEKIDRLKAIDLKHNKPIEKKELDEEDLKKITKDFSHKIINLSKKGNEELKKKKEDDYEVPEEVINFERTVDMNRFKEHNLEKNFKENRKNNIQEYDYLKDKPKNYLLVGNIKPETDMDELLIVIQSIGQVVKYNVIKDLCDRPSLVEVYYYTEKDAHKAKITLDGYKLNQFFLTAKTYKDYENEKLNNRTLIVGNLPGDVNTEDLIKVFSSFGSVMKIEMPMEEVKSKNKKIYNDLIENTSKEEKSLETIFKYTDEYFKEFVDSNYQNKKKKLTLIYQFHKVKQILYKIGTLNKEEMRNNTFYELKNLYVELKFHISKLFPKHIINSLIYHEIIKDSENAELIEGLSELNKSKVTETFNKIFQNMSLLIHKYDDKIKSLSEELTEDMIPLDPHEDEYKDLKQEKLQTTYTKKAEDEKSTRVLKNDLRQMNFYSLNIPLNKQIEKLKFYRSLSQEERKHVKEKYNVDFKVNTVDFIDYFLQFSRTFGIEIFDKQIELTNLFLSMSPIEKQYIGKKLAENPRNLSLFDDSIYEFLNLKRRAYINRPYDNLNLLNNLNTLKKNVSTRINTLTYQSKRRDNSKNFLITEQVNMQRHITSKYTEYWSKFVRDKRLVTIFAIRLTSMQGEVRSIIHKIKDSGDLYINKYMERAKSLMFPTVNEYYDKKSKTFMFKSITKDKMTEDSIKLDEEIKKNFLKGMNENENSDDQDIKRLEKLDPKLDFEIKNALDDIEHFQEKLVDKVISLNKFILPKNSNFDILKEHMKSKLTEYANSFIDNEEMRKNAYEKLEDSMRCMKYVDCNLEEKEFKFWQLVENLVAMEMEYLDKTRNIKHFFKELEEIFVGPIDKDSLVKILGTYEIIHQVNKSGGGGYELKQSFHRYFQTVQEMFLSELDKMDKIKEEREIRQELEEEINLDDLYNQRKELIENYVNKVLALEEFKKLKPSLEEKTKEELDSYKISQMGKDDIFIESDSDGEVELLKNEIRKKNYETQGKHDASSAKIDNILANYNLERGSSNKIDSELKAKVDKLKNKKKLYNRGYAFVTFANSDQAKRIFLFSTKIIIEGNSIKVLPKLTTTHEDLDFDFLKNKANSNAHFIRKKHEIEEARMKLNDFERQFKDKLDENDEEYKYVIEGYKDIFSDPYKRHDEEFNPLDSDEEAEVKNNIRRQEKESKLNHLWLYEDEKLEELRKIKDKKLTNKYIEWQLLKRGVAPEKKKEESKKGFTFYNDILEEIIGEEPQFKYEGEIKDYPGRDRSKKFGPTEFIEKYLGKDLLEIPAFRKNKKVSQFFQPLKELSERFPKEKFVESNKDYNKVVEQVSRDYVNFIKNYDEKKEPTLVTESKIIDRISPRTPVNLLLAPVIEERKNFIKENRDNLTYQTFLQRAVGDNYFRAEDFTQDFIDENELEDRENPLKKYEEAVKSINVNQPPEELEEIQQVLEEARDNEFEEYKDKEESKNEYFLKYFKKRGYNITNEPEKLDILPYGFKNRIKKEVHDNLDKVFAMSDFNPDLNEKGNSTKKNTSTTSTDKNKKTSLEKDVPNEEDLNQFDENILTEDKIRDLKNRKSKSGTSKNEEIMKSVLNKFNSLETNKITEIDNQGDTLLRFESFIKDKNSTQFYKKDELTRKQDENINYNYQKFKEEEGNNSGVYGFQKDNIKLEKEKEQEIEKLREKIKLEKQKMDFFKDLSTTFKEELETSQEFKEFFEDLKSDKKYMTQQKNHNLQVEPLYESVTPIQEVVASMKSNTFDKETYKKHFMNLKTEEEIINEWIKPEEMDRWYKQGRELQGINNENEKEMYDKIKLEYPALVDEKFIKFSENFGENFDTLLMNMIDSNDLFEDEYYFNPESHESIEQHLAKLTHFPNMKISVKKDQKGRLLIKREHKIKYKYDLDEIMNFDIKQEKEKLTKFVDEMDFSESVINEIEYKYQLQNLIEKHLRFKIDTDLEKIKENMKLLSQNDLEVFSNNISEIIDENNEMNENKKKGLVKDIIDCFSKGVIIKPDQEFLPLFSNDINLFYKLIREKISQNLKEKIYKDVGHSVRGDLELHVKNRVAEFFSKKIPLNSLRKSIIKIMSLTPIEINLLLDCFVKIIQRHEEIPIVKTSLDDNTISLMLTLVQKSNKTFNDYNITDSNKHIFIQSDLLSSFLSYLTEGLNPVEKIMTYGIFNLLPEDVEFNNPKDNYVDRNKYYSSIWTSLKNSIIKNNLLTIIEQTNESQFLKDHEFIINKEILNSSRTEEGIKREINEYSKKIKNFYKDFIRLNPTDLDYENFISDVELFTEEISQQITNKLHRKKYLSKWSQKDFVEERVNEENLYEDQLKQTNELLENHNVKDSINDDEILKSIQENMKKLNVKRRRLIKEQRPVIDDNYVRIL